MLGFATLSATAPCVALLCIRAVTPNLQSAKPDLSGPVDTISQTQSQSLH